MVNPHSGMEYHKARTKNGQALYVFYKMAIKEQKVMQYAIFSLRKREKRISTHLGSTCIQNHPGAHAQE